MERVTGETNVWVLTFYGWIFFPHCYQKNKPKTFKTLAPDRRKFLITCMKQHISYELVNLYEAIMTNLTLLSAFVQYWQILNISSLTLGKNIFKDQKTLNLKTKYL